MGLVMLDKFGHGAKLPECAVHFVAVHPSLDDEVLDPLEVLEGEGQLVTPGGTLSDQEAVMATTVHLGFALCSGELAVKPVVLLEI